MKLPCFQRSWKSASGRVLGIGKWLLALFVVLPLWAYQWPLPTKQIVQGWLAGRPASQSTKQHSLPNLGVWFGIEDEGHPEEVVQPYHSGEVIYFESSLDMNILGPVPKNIHHTIVVQHGKLLFRYSSDNLELRLLDNYQIDSGDLLFSRPKMRAEEQANPRLYMEIFDTHFQTVVNPKLLMPSVYEGVQESQIYLEKITLNEVADRAIKNGFSAVGHRPIRNLDQLLRGIYNLSFRFPLNQGPPLRLNVHIEDKKIYSELFDQVYSLNSKLRFNDRDVQDIYIPDEQDGKFFLGTIDLQDNVVHSSVRLAVDEEYIDGSHSIRNYRLRIR